MDSVIIVASSAIPLAIYKWLDPNKDMLRHFHQNDKTRYYLLQLSVAVLGLALAFHGRELFKIILVKIKNSL